jgi:hypothetical protein
MNQKLIMKTKIHNLIGAVLSLLVTKPIRKTTNHLLGATLFALVISPVSLYAEAEIAVPEGFLAQTFVAGISGPTALVFGPGGAFGDDLFVAEGAFEGVGRILKIDRSGAISSFASSPLLEFPKGAAFDLSGSFSGDLFVSLDVYCPGPIPSSCSSGGVVRITPAGAVSYFLDAFATSPGLFGAFDLAFGPGGAFGDNLFLADAELDSSGLGNILNVSPDGSLGVFVPSGSIKGASSLAFDRIGNFGGDLFVADPFTDPTFVNGTDSIMRVTPDGMASQFASSPLLSNPTALAFDTVGHFGHDLFVLDAGANAIYRVDATGTVTPFATGFSFYIWGGNLAFGPSGDLFVADFFTGRIIRISAVPHPEVTEAEQFLYRQNVTLFQDDCHPDRPLGLEGLTPASQNCGGVGSDWFAYDCTSVFTPWDHVWIEFTYEFIPTADSQEIGINAMNVFGDAGLLPSYPGFKVDVYIDGNLVGGSSPTMLIRASDTEVFSGSITTDKLTTGLHTIRIMWLNDDNIQDSEGRFHDPNIMIKSVFINGASAPLASPKPVFGDDGIVWHQPLARNGASEDTDPSAGRTVKYRFKRGSTIPIQIHALGCAGDVTSNASVIGKVTVFGDSNCDGAADGNATPIEFNGVGGGGGVMDKIGGHLKYNLDTKSLPTTTQCYILRVTVTDTSTGEEKAEEVLLQAK